MANPTPHESRQISLGNPLLKRSLRVGALTKASDPGVSHLLQGEEALVPIREFKIGNEAIGNTKIEVSELGNGDIDMILGVDFFLSHHIYFHKAEQRLYFTYNGGPVFDQKSASLKPAAQDVNEQPLAGSIDMSPRTSADELARQGEASFSRMQYSQALAKLDRAIQLDPETPEYYAQRAATHLALGQRALARADLDRTLKSKPDHEFALLTRGKMRLKDGDLTGAQADFGALRPIDQENVDVALAVSAAYEEANQFELAVAEDDMWIESHPRDARMADALNSRCWARALWNRKLDAAMDDCNRAVTLSHGRYAMLDSRAMMRLRMGQWKASIDDYNKALTLQEGPWSLYGRGLAEMHLGNTSAGKADIDKAATLAPELIERAKKIGLAP